MFTMTVPKYLWREAVLTTSYLINRMRTRILTFQTPLQCSFECLPQIRLFTSLPLKVFECVHIYKHNFSKLDQSVKCVFLSYNMVSNKSFVSMDVTFF